MSASAKNGGRWFVGMVRRLACRASQKQVCRESLAGPAALRCALQQWIWCDVSGAKAAASGVVGPAGREARRVFAGGSGRWFAEVEVIVVVLRASSAAVVVHRTSAA